MTLYAPHLGAGMLLICGAPLRTFVVISEPFQSDELGNAVKQVV